MSMLRTRDVLVMEAKDDRYRRAIGELSKHWITAKSDRGNAKRYQKLVNQGMDVLG
ncbi:hypothetical protein M427DRAFT_55301 [Gonapodya prolifera JEL478]|uniref:Uncharacterized protein n=1 Tax=Gonapodya prolifera (strain JEL478) TaxID=1344416 RepID=A0A139AJS2_GONPJ|nr:hypothetical protein M427DRAFT_55301 [Gonapodya prolifera JEL478]|eukprot:KXS16645.1 hypothetical protein M427DRAFT_55301 [Gonapodya prolifera JEL478]